MVESELNGILTDAERSFSYHNKTFEEAGISRDSLAEKYRGTAEKQVRRQLVLGKIIDQEKMTLADDELETGFAEMAATYNQPVETIKGFYEGSGDKLAIFKHAILEKKAIKLIMERNTVESVEPEKPAPEA